MRTDRCYRLLRHMKTYWLHSRSRMARSIRKGISLAICVFLLTPNVAFAQQIVPDGLTATQVQTSGNVTDITTSTFLGDNAFNSFSRFNVDMGNTVNLHVPSSATNLLNLVHSETSYINGILNSVKDGSIGGNVFFLNPYGVAVGSEGVVNVGSLNIITPTTDFMESFFDSNGVVSSSAVADVLEGRVPVGSTGLITVHGKINAISDIGLSAGSVRIVGPGSVKSGAVFEGTGPSFSDVVNIGGLVGGTSVSTVNGNIVITAVDDITVSGTADASAVIATDGAPGLAAGDVELRAGGDVTISYGTISAQAVGENSIGGSITVVAERTDETDERASEASTRILLDYASLKGNNISLQALSSASYEFESSTPVMGRVPSKHIDEGIDVDFDVVVAQSTATSEVIVGGGSVLEAARDIELVSDSSATVKTETKDKSGDDLSISFIYGALTSTSKVDVQSGATIQGSNLSITSRNTAAMNMSTQTLSKEGEAIEAAVAVADATVSSLAQISSGANVQISGDVSLAAANTNSFVIGVTAKARGDGIAGIAGVLFLADTDARALADADLSGLSRLFVEAVDDTVKNTVTAVSAAGGQETGQKVLGAGKKGTDFIKSKISKKAPQPDPKSGTPQGGGLKIAGTATIVDATHNSLARIGESVTIDAAKDVVVAAQTRNANLQNKAEASTGAKADDKPEEVTISAALAVGDYERTARAYIGEGSHVTAKRVGVDSRIVMPYGIYELISGELIARYEFDFDTDIDFETVKNRDVEAIIDELKGMVDQLEDPASDLKDLVKGPLLTGYANAAGSADDLGVAGSLTYLSFTNDSRAYLDKNATITLEAGPGTYSSWQTTTPTDRDLRWDAPLSISALTKHTGVYAAGNFSWTLKGTSGGQGASTVGGAYNQVNHNTTTKAYVAAGAVINQPVDVSKDVSIDAISDERVIALGPTSGRGTMNGLNGVFSLSLINSATEASVSNEAKVAARDLSLHARGHVISWSLTGALNMSQSAGVGATIAINSVTTHTKAFIGPNDEDKSDEDGIPAGEVRARKVDVEAVTDGRIESLSVAGAVASSSDSQDSSGGLLDKVKGVGGKLPGALGKLFKKTENADAAKQANSGYGGQAGSSSQPAQPEFGLAVSGSSSVNLGFLETKAYVYKGDLKLTEDDSTLTVQAVNDAHITAASGAAALAKAKNQSSEWSAGIAGSLAVNVLGNTTSAYLENSTVTDANDVFVRALAGGQQVAVALGTALNLSADKETAGAAAGSVSVSLTENKVSSFVDSSTVTGQSSDPDGTDRKLDVIAYDRTRILTGGGSLIGGGKGGIGAALTFSGIGNEVSAKLSGSTISNYDDLRVYGLTASLIASGGAMAGFTKGEETGTFGGSMVVNTITNSTTALVTDNSVVNVDNNVRILARDTKGIDEFDEIIDAQGGGLLPDEVDYAISDIFEDYLPTDGTTILSVAGVVQGGGNNVGISFAWNEVNNDFKAQVSGSTLSAGGGVDVMAYSGTLIAGLSVGAGVASGKFSGAGSVTVNETGNPLLGNSVTAEVTGTTLDARSLTIDAGDTTRILSLAGQATVSIQKVSLGGAIAHNLIGNTVSSRLEGNTTNVTTLLTVSSKNDSAIGTIAVAGGGSESFALNASISSAHIHNTTKSEIKNVNVREADNVSVLADDVSRIFSLSGAASFSNSTAVGGAISVNTITNTTSARVVGGSLGSQQYAIGSLAVKGQSGSIIRTMAAAAGGAETAAITGSLSDANIASDTEALVEVSEIIVSGAAEVSALDNSQISSLSGQAAASSSAAVGGSVSINTVTNETRARILSSSLRATGSFTVKGESGSIIMTAAVAAGASESTAVAGSVSNATIANETEALVQDSGIASSDKVEVTAVDGSVISSLSGGAVASSTAAVGGALSTNIIGNKTKARIVGGSLGSQQSAIRSLAVKGLSGSIITTAAMAAGGSESAAVTGSGSTASIVNETEALVGDSDIHASGTVDVTAQDRSEIYALSGQVAASTTAAVGGAVSLNTVTNTTVARMYDTGDADTVSASNITVQSSNASSILASALAGSVSTGSAAVGGSAATSVIVNKTEAEMLGIKGSAEDVSVLAMDDSTIESISGGVTVSSTAAVGGSVSLNDITNTTSARFKDSDSVQIANKLNVQALNTSAIRSLALAGGASGNTAVVGSFATSIILNTTEAVVSGITGADTSAGAVDIIATDDSEIESLSGGAAGSSTVAVGGAVSLNDITNTTSARLEDSSFSISGDLLVQSLSTSFIAAASAAIGASSSAAVNGSVTTSTIINTTEALISNTEGSAGAAKVEASDISEIDALAGSASASGSAAVGGAALVSVIVNSTTAHVRDSRLSLTAADLDSLLVSATNASTIDALGASVGVASAAAVNGALAAADITNTTEALVETSTVDAASGRVTVTASDTSSIKALAGIGAGGGSAAVGGAALGSAIANTARAKIDRGSVTSKSLLVEAVNDSTMWTTAESTGASGAAAVSGSAATSLIANRTVALVENATLAVTERAEVAASDEAQINTLSGNLGGSGTASVGGAVTVATIVNTTKSSVSNAGGGSIKVGSLVIRSSSLNGDPDPVLGPKPKINIGAIGATGSGTAAVSGSLTTAVIANSTEAELVDADFVESADSVTVTAADASWINAFAGNVSASGAASVGGAMAVNVIANTTKAQISRGSLLVTGMTEVKASNESTIATLAATGAVSGGASVTGSVATSHIVNKTEAEMVGVNLTGSVAGDSGVSVLAEDKARIASLSGSAAASGVTSVGAATSFNRIGNTTRARITGGNISDVGSVMVKGIAAGEIDSIAAAAGTDVNVGVAGSIAVNLMDNDTESYIDGGAKVTARNNVGVIAENHDVVRNVAGALGVGLAIGGVGASVAVNHIGGSTRAYISGSDTEVTALGLDSSKKMTVAEGALAGPIDLGEALLNDEDGANVEFEAVQGLLVSDLKDRRQTEQVTGVAVNASSTRMIGNVAATVAGGLYVGAAGTTTVNVIAGETHAFVEHSKINTKFPYSSSGMTQATTR